MQMDMKKLAQENMIYKTLTGSRAYGTFTPESDTDYRGVFCLPKNTRNDIFTNVENVQDKSVDDMEYDELAQFIKLTADCNPNKIELLFTLPEHHILVHPAFKLILDNKYLFLTKRARHTFGGYAFSQKSRMERHKKWIDKLENKSEAERLSCKPSIISYLRFINTDGFEENIKDKEVAYNFFSDCFATKINHTVYKLYKQDENFKHDVFTSYDQTNLNYIDISYEKLKENNPVFLGTIIVSHDAYDADLKEFNHYMKWRKERNVARAELEAKYGADTKHMMHSVRLLRMAKEILTTGECIVSRPDAKELLAIRNGAMTYERMIEFFNETEIELDKLYEKSTLPKSPDRKKISELYQEAVEIFDKSKNSFFMQLIRKFHKI